MRVPAILYADRDLVREMDDKVLDQMTNVASLPGIVRASYAMPDAHWGYGFPIGGVAAFDPDLGGVISGGGVGFDISCGVRNLLTGLTIDDLEPLKERLVTALFRHIPAGVGRTGRIHLDDEGMGAMLRGGARWAVERGWGRKEDLERIEDRGCIAGADPSQVSKKARHRQANQMGTLGSGNHYVEVQWVAEVHHQEIADAWGLHQGDVVVSIHCGSRGLGHQIGTEYFREMAIKAKEHGLKLPDRELACAPARSKLGKAYLGAMRGGINCALANRQIITHLAREVFDEVLPKADLQVLYDVSHNTCKEEVHEVDGAKRRLLVHRKGATRAFGPGHPQLPPDLQRTGQPVLIGGSMGTESWILAGVETAEERAFSSACHGAGRRMSRTKARKRWQGRDVTESLAHRGILVRSRSMRGIAEEAPGAYKDVAAVVEVTERAGLARKVARVVPIACVKG
ncbi:MAG: RtcB family protein [Deltaproteobacteria bacterium]|nr:RtcB family protein [Deltaproteobacteria bacterium]